MDDARAQAVIQEMADELAVMNHGHPAGSG